MASSSSAEPPRPGQDPLHPHQDLRIPNRVPSQYLSQALPSSAHLSVLSTPPVAVQIASLHRAAEVARFEWRAAQRRHAEASERRNRSESHSSPSRRAYLPTTGVSRAEASSSSAPYRRLQSNTAASNPSPANNSAADSSNQNRSRIFSSSLEAYLSAAREVTRSSNSDAWEVIDDITDDIDDDFSDDTSVGSDDTLDEVVASTLRPLHERRRDSNDRRQQSPSSAYTRRMISSATIPSYSQMTAASSSRLNESSSSTANTSSAASHVSGDVQAEGHVWDRMVSDLAVGAGVGGSDPQSRISSPSFGFSPYSRGIGGGIAASMLALSAAIPRPDASSNGAIGGQRTGTASAPSRLLPHPIWARRYPGAAGEWLRCELARRAESTAASHHAPAATASAALRGSATNRTSTGQTDRASSPTTRNGATDAEISPATTSPARSSNLNIEESPSHSARLNGSAISRNSFSPASSPWRVLQFPSLDPTTRGASSGGSEESTTVVATIRSDTNSDNALAVPSNVAALAPTPPPSDRRHEERARLLDSLHSSSPGTSQRRASITRATNLTPRITSRASLERTADRAASESSPASAASTQRPESLTLSSNGQRVILSQTDRDRAAETVARLARMARTRERLATSRQGANQQANAMAESPASGSSEASANVSNDGRGTSSRAVRGGMDYIRRLRELDGLEPPRRDVPDHQPRFAEPVTPPRPEDVFPWYQPTEDDVLSTSMTRLSVDDDQRLNENEFDPDGSSLDWYQMARARMAAQSSLVGRAEVNDDPNGERVGQEEPVPLGVRRRILTPSSAAGAGVGTASASQRLRNRSALVMADDDMPTGSGNFESWNVASGWTVIDQRPASPVRATRDEGSDSVTTWFRGPAFSSSPVLMEQAVDDTSNDNLRRANADSQSTSPRLAAMRQAALWSDNALLSRINQRHRSDNLFASPSVDSSSLAGADALSSGNGSDAASRLADLVTEASARLDTIMSLNTPSRRPEYSLASRTGMTGTSYAADREQTPSPEPQTHPRPASMERSTSTSPSFRVGPSHLRHMSSVGARLEEEFRARQGELRQREERLRNEVARRRMELDQLRQQQGRIGRVIERNRREPTSNGRHSGPSESIESDGNYSPPQTTQRMPGERLQVDSSATTRTRPSEDDPESVEIISATTEATPLLQRSHTSLVRRGAVRDSAPNLRSIQRHSVDFNVIYGAAGIR